MKVAIITESHEVQLPRLALALTQPPSQQVLGLISQG